MEVPRCGSAFVTFGLKNEIYEKTFFHFILKEFNLLNLDPSDYSDPTKSVLFKVTASRYVRDNFLKFVNYFK